MQDTSMDTSQPVGNHVNVPRITFAPCVALEQNLVPFLILIMEGLYITKLLKLWVSIYLLVATSVSHDLKRK